jgi:hypothetical protein
MEKNISLTCWTSGEIWIIKNYDLNANAIIAKNFTENRLFKKAFYELDYEKILTLLVIMCCEKN